ncbi:MAG: hypothetical protein R2724_09695 [Bryobacterales bacterium]
MLASQADGVVLVTRAGKTPRSLLRQTVAQLKRTGAVVLGAAVTQLEDRRLGYSRYYGYGTSTSPDALSEQPAPQAISGD